MTDRPYDPALRATIADVLKAGENHADAQCEREAAIRKARRDLDRLQRDGVLPTPPDAA